MKIDHFLAIFSPEKVRYDKSKSSHDDQHEKTKKIYVSDFWFLKIHHRDICKTFWEIFQNLELWKIKINSRPFFYQKYLDMANEKYLMTISMEKWRKCTSQSFDFWNFIAQIFAKQVERFSKMMNLWKIWKLPILKAIFWPYMVGYDRQKLFYDNQHRKMKKIYISDFSFWKLCHKDLC